MSTSDKLFGARLKSNNNNNNICCTSLKQTSHKAPQPRTLTQKQRLRNFLEFVQQPTQAASTDNRPRQMEKSSQFNKLTMRQQAFSKKSLTLALLVCATFALLLGASASNADYADQYNNNANQQQQQQPAKAKKIQIVYIKVPLAKLKPSLANSDYAASNNQSNYGAKHDATETKPQGSHSEPQQQQQQQQHNQLSSHQSSFLIPMAVVQTNSDAEQSNLNQLEGVGANANSAFGSASTNHALHSANNNNQDHLFRPIMMNGRQQQQQQSPMQLHQQQLMQAAGVKHGINHGFMSSFLLGEKEKMSAAAMRLQLNQPQSLSSPDSPVASAPNALASNLSAPTNFINPTTNNNSNNNNNNKGPTNGLMPFMMMPFSHMPDNMIGQAYNAAVGQALPVESGSPSSMLSSPSSGSSAMQANNNKHANNNNYGGGNSGTSGEPATSHGTASSGSYGSNGPNQHESGSSGNAYQQSGSGYAGSGPSSGFGSGINSFGASVAFSDYPTGQSTGSGQQTYAQQQQSSSNNIITNSNTRHHSQSAPIEQQSADAYGKLRQAKKTIIPIVVQVEHAIMEANGLSQANYNNNNNNAQPAKGTNKYLGGGGASRGHRHLGGKRSRGTKQQQPQQQAAGNYNNEMAGGPMDLGAAAGAQYINAANAQDINQITAAINAENAASAAAALAQADMAFGNGPAQANYNNGPQQARPQQSHRPMQQSQYASNLQSAASALLANTHPVIQAAASGGLASVSKLGAKLGEIIALPSMQVPNSISSIGSSLPSALSSITNQMAVQMNQAVQQVAKEHPTAHAFARQVAQHAGINLANFSPQQQQQQLHHQQHPNSNANQQMVAASDQHAQAISPQAQLQNLKLSIGQNLQSAAAQLIGAHQKANAQSAASLLANPLAALYPQAMNAALKQFGALSPVASQAVGFPPNQMNNIDPHHAQSSSIVPVQQQFLNQQQLGQTSQQQSSDPHAPSSSQQLIPSSELASSSPAKPGKSNLKSKFLSFFQPPKFISNLLSWNDRADSRNDKGSVMASDQTEGLKDEQARASSSNATEAQPPKQTLQVAPVAAPAAAANSSAIAEQPKKAVEVQTPTNSTGKV